MKELSIKEKAQRYDEALKVLHKYDGAPIMFTQDLKEEMFPELKESEDEKVKKEIGNFISYSKVLDETKERWLAWLEKQGIDISSFPEEQQVFMQKYTNLDKITLIKLLAERDANNAEIIESFEKQGEKKPIEPQQDMLSQEKYAKAVDECVYGEQNSADVEELNFFDDFRKTDSEVEPKFKVGDYIINSQGTLRHIINVDKVGYQTDGGWLSHDAYEKTFHLWTIQDAKDGDVLKEDSCIFIIKKMVSNGTAIVHCCLFDDGELDSTGSTLDFDVDCTYPATKEQRDLLFSKMKEAGYDWNAEKKELKKIEQKSYARHKVGDTIYYNSFGRLVSFVIANIVEDGTDNPMYEDKDGNSVFQNDIIEQKSAWSEEDEKAINDIMWIIEAYKKNGFNETHMQIANDSENWLKSLKDRVQLKSKQEWSEEDGDIRDNIIRDLKRLSGDMVSLNQTYQKEIHWLKSLKERYAWKPSDYQLEALESTTESCAYSEYKDCLRELIGQLKKLKG